MLLWVLSLIINPIGVIETTVETAEYQRPHEKTLEMLKKTAARLAIDFQVLPVLAMDMD